MGTAAHIGNADQRRCDRDRQQQRDDAAGQLQFVHGGGFGRHVGARRRPVQPEREDQERIDHAVGGSADQQAKCNAGQPFDRGRGHRGFRVEALAA
ncbi:hypothetical protein G6F57_022780 [Rhizopus arrhizus]|nr:hypothetical protein G6F57_022780 [Rhizopus arrhizus]